MNKREDFKTLEFEGRKWRIGKFDAMTGSYIAYKLMEEFVPALGAAFYGDMNIAAPSKDKSMSKADFIDLQTDCLKVCAELLPAGPADVIYSPGEYGVENFTPKLALALTIQALAYNLKDFFDASLLSSLAEALGGLGIFLPDAKTSTNSSSGQ